MVWHQSDILRDINPIGEDLLNDSGKIDSGTKHIKSGRKITANIV